MLRRTSRAVIALLGFAAASFGTSRAALAAPTVLPGNTTLGGTKVYDELVIPAGGTLNVQPYKPTVMDSGKLIIKANRITVESSAKISATAAGYPGVELAINGTGTAEMGTNGGGMASMSLGHPGGGGAYAGKGAVGLNAACAAFAGDVTGGAEFYSTMPLLTLGSAGGAANVMSAVTHGAAGGGMIFLQAAEIIIDGIVEANGDSSIAQSGVAPGGGSGGAIQLLTSSLVGQGTLSAAGGNGADANGDMAKGIQANHGGGGSGGVIYITGPMPSMLLKVVVDGGRTGMTCGPSPMTDGEVGKVVVVTPMPTDFCVDVDGDSFRSIRCGGMDCDDSSDTVHPGGKEVCDGLDNDCLGGTDDGDLCQTGEYCAPLPVDNQMHCRPIPDGGVGGPDGGARPDHVEFGGGCGVRPALGEDVPWWLGATVPALGFLGLALRSARRRRRLHPPANS